MQKNQNPQKLFDGNELNALKDFVKTAEKNRDIKKISPSEIAKTNKEEGNSQYYTIDSKVQKYEIKSEGKPSSSIQIKEQQSSINQSQPYVMSSSSTITGKEDYLSDEMKKRIDQDEREILCRFGYEKQSKQLDLNPDKKPITQSTNTTSAKPDNKVQSNKVVEPIEPPSNIPTIPNPPNSIPQKQTFSNDQKEWEGNINFGNIENRQKIFEPKNDNQIKTPFPPTSSFNAKK